MDKGYIFLWLSIALISAFFISPFASSSPDGLEKVAGDKGFLEKGEAGEVIVSPVPGYAWPGIENERIATGLAGAFGTLTVFGLAYAIGKAIKR